MRSISEPDAGGLATTTDKTSALFANRVASAQNNHTGWTGSGSGSSTRFANDADNDGNTTDEIVGLQGIRVYRPDETEATGLPSNALAIAADNDWATSAVFIRIQNTTAQAISTWKIGGKFYISEPDTSNKSLLQFAYAVSDDTNPDAMTFTPYGTPPAVTPGMVLSTTPAYTLSETITTTPVAPGGYLVLAFRDTQNNGDGSFGSAVFLDDLTTTAVVPSSVTTPTLSTQPSPASQTVATGANVTYTVSANANGGTLSYQWKRGTTNVGTNSASLSLSSVTTADSGDYSVVVSNSAGSVTSNSVTLTVSAAGAVTISTPPANQVVLVGSTATFSLVASANGTLSYQWRDDGVNVGTNSSSYTTAATVLGDNASTISCVVTNTVGISTATATTSATLTVDNNAAGIGLTTSALGTATGSASVGQASSTLYLSGTGSGFSSSGDNAYLASKSVSGNFQAIVQVASVQGPGRAGLMLRDGTSTTARFVEIGFSSSSNTATYSSRRTAGSSTITTGSQTVGATPNRWLMLERIGSTIKVAVSNDDVTYTPVEVIRLLNLSTSLDVVLFVTGATETSAAFEADGTINPAEIVSLPGDVTTGLVGRWKLDETSGTTAADSRVTGTATPGTLAGNAAWNTGGMLGGAISLDGTGDYVAMADSANHHGQKMSFALWINPTTTDATARGLLSKRTGNTNQRAFALFNYTANKLFIDIGSSRVDTGIVLGTGWKHLVATFDGSLSSNRLKVYVNGATTPSYQGNPGTTTSIPNTSASTRIGTLDATTVGFIGTIDDVRIYNSALSPADIANIYAQ
jgi:hypothetical protein